MIDVSEDGYVEGYTRNMATTLNILLTQTLMIWRNKNNCIHYDIFII